MSENLQEVVIKIEEMEFYDNDFEIAIKEACEKYNIDDLCKEGQRRWKAVMRYVGKRVFSDNRILKDKDAVYLDNNKIPTNNNKYNYNALNILCDYYMDLSDRYNKLISAEAFSLFLNMSRDTIGRWRAEDSSSMRFYIYKKLKDFRLECIKDDSYDNGNVTGTMYVGNVEYGTNLPGAKEDSIKERVLTVKDLPVYEDSDYNNALKGI